MLKLRHNPAQFIPHHKKKPNLKCKSRAEVVNSVRSSVIPLEKPCKSTQLLSKGIVLKDVTKTFKIPDLQIKEEEDT